MLYSSRRRLKTNDVVERRAHESSLNIKALSKLSLSLSCLDAERGDIIYTQRPRGGELFSNLVRKWADGGAAKNRPHASVCVYRHRLKKKVYTGSQLWSCGRTLILLEGQREERDTFQSLARKVRARFLGACVRDASTLF